jgi:transcriptional regulator with XRE-family HTH domain
MAARKKAARFGDRVRERIEASNETMGEIARRAEMDPSALSKLVSKDDPRTPQLEHVLALARGLATTAAELVDGTDAADVFADWVPRKQLDREVAARIEAADREHALTGELEAARGQVTVLREHVAAAECRVEHEAQRARRAEVDVGEARALAAVRGRQIAALAARVADAEAAWADIQSRLANAHAQLQQSRSEAARNANFAVFGTIFAGVLGAKLSSGGRS